MRRLLLPLATLVVWGCSDTTDSRVPAAVAVSPGTVTFDAVGATAVVHAVVTDQGGSAITRASLTWSSSAAAVTVASAGGDSAIVTAAANGTATVTATAGSATGSVAVQVAQVPAAIHSAGGDAQTATVGATLPLPLRVTVTDRLNAPVAGQTVTFGVAQGNGTLSATTAVTGADGSAAVTWTLGTTAVMQVATASISRVSTLVFFSANAVAGPPTSEIASGDGQVAAVGTAVAVRPSVRLTDAFGNPVPGVTVNFAVTGGGGSVTDAAAVSGADGRATVGSWTLGNTPGANTLSATVAGSTLPAVVFTATALNPVPGRVDPAAVSAQAAMAGAAVTSLPAVVVRDPDGNPIAGLTVTFAVASGGGTLTGATATTDVAGVARVGSWVLGTDAGPNRVTATVQAGSITGNPVSFSAVGCTGGGGGGYAITLCPTTAMTASQLATFANAAARWRAVVASDLPDVGAGIPVSACGAASPAVDFAIDDLLIFAAIEPIDGAGHVLGQAGWCVRRSAGLPVAGLMRFDAADVSSLELRGLFGDVILHEMGHVLGIGSFWSDLGLVQDASTALVQDTWYSGMEGLAGFNAIGGATYTGGNKVPVENTGGSGTANVHWREAVLANELMTGYLNTGSNPLSELTVRSLVDLGYTVNVAAADPFFLTLSVQGQLSPAGGLKLVNDLWRGPRYAIDRRGLLTRIP